MDKQEIIEVLKEMEKDFQKFPVLAFCSAGFCYWLDGTCILFEEHNFIIKELEKDKISDKETSFWYEKFETNKNYEASIQARLNHLDRTIARLENELKTEQNGTL